MLDRSGSMSSNNGLSDSKDALKQLVNFLPPGLSTIGLTSFSDQGGDITEVPMTLIPNPVGTVISNLHTAIDNISTANRTALFDGAHYGLSLLDDYRSVNGTNAIRLGMLLSDGNDNQSVNDITSVINAYTSSNVPLHTFGYGNGSHHNILSELSSQTGGDHHAYVTDGDLLHNAFLNAISSAVNMQVLPGQWNPGATLPLTVDPTHTSITLVVTYELGDATGSLDFEIVDALDNLVNPAPTIVRNTPAVINYPYNETATITINGTTLANHGTGIWHIDFISAGNITINPNVSITSTTRSKTPDLMVENLSGPNISYPQPLLLTASVVYDNLLTDLTISAVLKKPDNTSVPIQLFDDGSHGDAVAKDGIYSNVYSSYDQNGTYTLTVVADNHSGTAKLTDHGDAFCKAPDGTAPTYTLTPYSDNFARQKSISFNVQGVVSDDHGNDPTNPSVLPLDNSLVAGKIEYPADMDAFVITVPANQDVIVRVSDMDPAMSAEMKIYGPDGVTLIGYTNTNVGSTENGYLMIPVSSSIHSRNIYVTVNDLDDNVSNAVYKISAGPQKFGDVVAAPGIEVYAKDEGLHENNIVKPRMYIKNTGNESLSNFTVNYYFTSENGKTPVLENYYSPYCNIILSHISSDLYMVSFNYQGFTLEPGATVPDNSGSVIGIRYNDWSSMDKTNDYSNPGSDTFTKNDRIAVFSDGVLVSGSFPLTM